MKTGALMRRGATFAGRTGVFVAACAAMLPQAALGCGSGTPPPLTETWTAAKTKVNGAEIVIYSAPTDHGAQLQITSGIDKSLWVASVTNASLLKLSTKGAATYYATPTTNSAPEAITQNGKAMYFTEWNSGCAGSINAAGRITEYRTGLTQNMSTNMALGVKKTAWFVTDNNGIGRLSKKGTVKLFPFPDETTQPTAITEGPDGNIWFLENQGPNIGKVTPAGVITEYSTGLGNPYSFGVTAGSDGRVWFADNGNNSIAAITTDGTKVTDYTAGFTGDPISIVGGPDGNLYFGETTAVVGRITPAGVVTEYPFPATENTFPILSVTVGPDGNIWFANNSHAQVGVLKLKK